MPRSTQLRGSVRAQPQHRVSSLPAPHLWIKSVLGYDVPQAGFGVNAGGLPLRQLPWGASAVLSLLGRVRLHLASHPPLRPWGQDRASVADGAPLAPPSFRPALSASPREDPSEKDPHLQWPHSPLHPNCYPFLHPHTDSKLFRVVCVQARGAPGQPVITAGSHSDGDMGILQSHFSSLGVGLWPGPDLSSYLPAM